MNPISAFVEEYTLPIKACIGIAIIGTLLFQCHRIKSLEGDAVLYKAATAGYAGAQTTNLATIADLQIALNDMVESQRMDEARAASAANASALAQQEISNRLHNTEKELADVYATNANARAWGNTGVDAAVLRRLPKPAATDHHEGRREAGARAGAPAAGTGAH